MKRWTTCTPMLDAALCEVSDAHATIAVLREAAEDDHAEIFESRRLLRNASVDAIEAADRAASEIAALQSQLASESRQIRDAREAVLVKKLRDVLDIVTRIGGYMSVEDQQTCRDARAEVGE